MYKTRPTTVPRYAFVCAKIDFISFKRASNSGGTTSISTMALLTGDTSPRGIGRAAGKKGLGASRLRQRSQRHFGTSMSMMTFLIIAASAGCAWGATHLRILHVQSSKPKTV